MIGPRDLDRIVERIVAMYDPDTIYLFGSYAKGNMTQQSDLDFIVVKRTNLPLPMRGRDVVAILAEVPVDIDLIFLTPEELELECRAEHSLIGIVLPSAVMLYSRTSAATASSGIQSLFMRG
jgi:uncharacterized protein